MNTHKNHSVSASSENGLIAALDLGSNSFHLLLAKPRDGAYEIVETLKEKVQLLSGCQNGIIQDAAFERARSCIARFKQRLVAVPREQVFVRGTHALRQAVNAEDFIAEVSQLLGTEVRVISGEEEAHLVYQAVNQGTGLLGPTKVVIDIGGGSTEIAVGQDSDGKDLVSLSVGCVSLTDRFIKPSGQSVGFLQAKAAVIEAVNASKANHPHVADAKSASIIVGTSGTIESIDTVLKSNGWTIDAITADGIRELERAIVEEQWLVEAGLPGLSPERVDIFTAGAAVVCGCFEALELSEMYYADVSLQHGILFEAIGVVSADVDAEKSVENLARDFAVDFAQANRVRRQCANLFAGTEAWWQDDADCQRLLEWAATLHELGRRINRRHYHRHGAYIIKNSHIHGLTQHQQNVLALLVRGHRRSLPRLAFQAFDPSMVGLLVRLVSLLRIAVILERSHSDAESPTCDAQCTTDSLALTFVDHWLAKHPLSRNELEIEIEQMAQSGITLRISD